MWNQVPGDNPLIFFSIAVLLLAIAGLAVWLSVRTGRRSEEQPPAESKESQSFLTETDRQAMLTLLQQLASWTTEYSGNVSSYQSRLGNISREFQRDAASAKPPNTTRVLSLLGEIMQSNASLQQRLESAEKQLDRQTRQIESYLTEARTDGLTQLANRRAFDAKIEEMFGVYRKGGKSFALAIIDIDHFKKINDTYGHQSGDDVLRFVAAAFRQAMESAYMIARYGGEEFVVILPGPLRVAADRIDAVRKSIARERIETSGKELQISFSAGLSEPRQELVAAHMIRRADEALYSAKNMGRNRVYYHDGTQPVLLGAPELAGPL
jgi:diguanylate cyclase